MPMPHGWCLLWNWDLLFAHIASDLLIAASYYAIPLILIRVRRALTDWLGRHVVLSFALFIMACGTTHVVDIVVIWFPWYWLQAAVKIVTAGLSVTTAVQLARLTLAYREPRARK